MAVKKTSQMIPKTEKSAAEISTSSTEVTLPGEGYYHIRTKRYRVLVWTTSVEKGRAECIAHGEEPINDPDDYFFGTIVDITLLTDLKKKMAA